MKNVIDLETLEAQLKQLDFERDLLLKYIAFRKEQLNGQQHENAHSHTPVETTSYSVRGRVVDATIELIHKLRRQVTNSEILNHLAENNISLGNAKNKQTVLAAMLSQELKKKNPRLKKVARGTFDIKR